jgi:hypothetical protein
MQGTTENFQLYTRLPHHNRSRLDVYRDDAYIETVDSIISGSCTMDATAKYRRRFDAVLVDQYGDKTPGEMRDLFAPFGTEVRLYLGLEITTNTDVTDIDMRQTDWSQGTLTNMIADASGDLILD